jgi:hypothetical protein
VKFSFLRSVFRPIHRAGRRTKHCSRFSRHESICARDSAHEGSGSAAQGGRSALRARDGGAQRGTHLLQPPQLSDRHDRGDLSAAERSWRDADYASRRAGSGRARRPARRRSHPHRQWSAARHGLSRVECHRPRQAGGHGGTRRPAAQWIGGSRRSTRARSTGDAVRHGGRADHGRTSRGAITIATRGSSPYCSRASAPAHGRSISSR